MDKASQTLLIARIYAVLLIVSGLTLFAFSIPEVGSVFIAIGAFIFTKSRTKKSLNNFTLATLGRKIAS